MKKPNIALPTIYGKAICHLLKKLFISHICHQKICSVCFKTLNQLWTSKTYWLLTFFRFRKTNIYSCVFSAWKKLHDMAVSAFYADTRLHKTAGVLNPSSQKSLCWKIPLSKSLHRKIPPAKSLHRKIPLSKIFLGKIPTSKIPLKIRSLLMNFKCFLLIMIMMSNAPLDHPYEQEFQIYLHQVMLFL